MCWADKGCCDNKQLNSHHNQRQTGQCSVNEPPRALKKVVLYSKANWNAAANDCRWSDNSDRVTAYVALPLRSWLWVGHSNSKIPIHNSVSDRRWNDVRESKSLIFLLKRSDSGWQGQKHGYFLLVADSAWACVGTWLTLEEQEHNKREKEGEGEYKYRERRT